MRDIVHSYVRKFREERRERRKFLGVLLCLALAVAGGIMWQFKTTGIAYTNEAQCGIEEHTHSDDCYAWVLTGKTGAEETQEAEAVVVETAAAENAAGESLTKSDSEAAAEAETQDAAAETADVTSQAAESDESADAAAADTAADVSAAESETAVASETVSAASTESTAVATSEETLPAQVLLTEATETEDWYLSHGYEKVLICGKEEHTHTIECLSDETADLETAEVWEASLPSLTGVWADDVVAIAESQIGYAESTLNFTLSEDGTTRKGYTRYGAWYGNVYGDWDAMFAAFCLHYAGVSESDFPVNSGAYAWSVSLKEAGLYQSADNCTPSAGDLAFLDKDQDGTVDTVAVITNVNDTTLTVVEGNSNDAVEENTYEISDGVVVGYGVLPEQNSDVEVYTASANGVTVTVTAPTGALPENAVLSVTLYEEDSDEYAAAAETIGYEPETAEVVATEDGIALASEDDTETETVATSGLAVLDICFMVGNKEVEPSEAVTVSIDASAIIPEEVDASTIEVQHLTENEDGEVEAVLVADATEETAGTVTVDAEEATAVAEFEVESFSNFTITWSSSGGGPGGNSSKSITATAYLSGTSTVIDGASGTISVTSGNAINLTSSNSSLSIAGYELTSAVLEFDNTSYTVTSLTVTIASSGSGMSQTTTYSYSWVNSDGTTGNLSSYSGTPTISLYYTAVPTVTITDVTETSSGYTLSTSVSTFAGTPTYTWSVTSGASISGNNSTAALTWDDGITDGTVITVTVTATYAYEDSDGNTVTETDSDTYTLIYGASQSQTVSGGELTIYFLESDGSVITGVGSASTSLTGSEVTAATLAGYYTVSADGMTYTYYAAYTDYSMTTEIYSIYYNNGAWYYRTSSSGSWIKLDPSTIYLVYCVGTTGEVVSTSSASSTSGYYHIDVRIEGSIKVTVSNSVAQGEDITVTKNWVDDDNSGSTRPESITVYLTDEDGTKLMDSSGNYYSAILTAANNWSYTWTGLTLEAGTYGVTEDTVAGYTVTSSTTFEVTDQTGSGGSGSEDDGDTYTGTLTVTKLSAVYITKSDGTIIYVSMRPGTTSDDNSSDGTNYEYQSLYGHDGYTSSGPYNLSNNETITVVVSFTYTYYDEDGNEYTGTVKDFAITTTVNSTNNACDNATSGNDTQGFDVVLSAEDILEKAGVITTEASASLTNTLSEASVTIKKVDASKKDLSGATFTLVNESGYYYDGGAWSAYYSIITLNSQITATLSNGTYTLTEIGAPDGYNLLTSSITFSVSSSGVTLTGEYDSNVVSVSDDGLTITVVNTAGAVLPSTGGTGTYLYTLAGLLLILSTVCLMYKNLRRKGDLPY